MELPVRPAVFILATHAGQRARAILHLKWSDIDFAAATITWPGQYQKQGKSLVRPLTWPVYSALLTAGWWRTHDNYSGDWVFYASRIDARAKDAPTPYATIHHALLMAEQQCAGLVHQAYRALHGGRRHVVSEVIELTGDRMLGLEYVGDVDTKALRSYDRRVSARITKAAAVLDAREERARLTGTAEVARTIGNDQRSLPTPSPHLFATKRHWTSISRTKANPRGQFSRFGLADSL